MVKVVINACHGGFSLSREAYDYLGIPWDGHGYLYDDSDKRSDPKLVECVEKLGDDASGAHAELKIVEVPDDVKWHIEEYDGKEWVAENHRMWE